MNKDVAYTSVQAYRHAVMNGTVRTQRDKIFRWLCEYTDVDKGKGYTRNEIAEYLGLRLSAVCGRIRQLVTDEFVAEIGRRPDKFTGVDSKIVVACKTIGDFEQLRF